MQTVGLHCKKDNMTSKFTLRDFLVYFTTGALFIVSIDIVYFDKLLNISSTFFQKYEFIKEFSGILIVFIIPIIYLTGHLLHSVGILSLWIYKLIHNHLTKWELRKCKIIEWIRILLHFLMYRNKIINAVIQENKKNSTWESVEVFWNSCAKLQNENKFTPAEYWFTLNDLFKGLYTAFLFSSIMSFTNGKNILGLIFILLMLISHFRAIQFGNNFVKTVKRLSKE